MIPLRALLCAVVALLLAAPAAAQDFPALSGRVVDQAELLAPEQEQALTERLEALERQTSRQLVVATVASLGDRPIEDYANGLFRAWRLGQANANNGVLLLVAPNERKVRIEVGYGLEGIVTDALSDQLIRNQILPRFRDGDFPGGITAGVDGLIEQLQAPPEAAEQRVRDAEGSAAQATTDSSDGFPSALFWIVIVIVVLLPIVGGSSVRFGRRRYGRRYRASGAGAGAGEIGRAHV